MDKLENMKKVFSGVKVKSTDFNAGKTAIIVVDMIEGFVNIGNFASPRVKEMSPNIVNLLNKFEKSRRLFFKDVHHIASKEFNAYVEHCVDIKETELIEELKEFAYGDKYKDLSCVVEKNSTNGFLAKGFKDWLDSNKDIEKFIVVGCVTDICVSDFAKTLQCYIYENDLDKEVIVPINCVETYDLAPHYGDMMSVFALYSMKLAGIKIVEEIM